MDHLPPASESASGGPPPDRRWSLVTGRWTTTHPLFVFIFVIVFIVIGLPFDELAPEAPQILRTPWERCQNRARYRSEELNRGLR